MTKEKHMSSVEQERSQSETSFLTNAQPHMSPSLWARAGIRTKIVVPLVALMFLSLLGSMVGFGISTESTRNTILDEQLTDEAQRLTESFKQRKHEVFSSAMALSRNPDLQYLLEQPDLDRDEFQTIENQVVMLRNHYLLDQVLVMDTEDNKRMNISTFSDLSRVRFFEHAKLSTCNNVSQIHILTVESSRIMVACSPIWATTHQNSKMQHEVTGVAYTVQNISKVLNQIHRELGLTSEIWFAEDISNEMLESSSGAGKLKFMFNTYDEYRAYPLTLNPGDDEINIVLMHSAHKINRIVGSGFRVMLVSSGMILILLLSLGIWLAQSFTRPILKLSRVARAVASGDLGRRANLTHNDEIGQLGRVFDEATTIISDLLEQRARKASELNTILQSMADGVLAVDNHERIVLVNPVASTLLGKDATDLLDRPLDDLVDLEDPLHTIGLQHIVDQVRREMSHPERALPEERIALGERIVRVQTTPTRGTDTALSGAVVIIQDVTQAVEAERAKNAFIATASHEMRTPLTAMKGFVDVFYLSGTDNLNENQTMFLTTIKRQTDSMVQMVNNLLEVARVDQGAMKAEQRWVALDTVIEESLANLSAAIDQRKVDLQLDIAPDLPHIWIDSMHLRRILTNLISNAVKYVYEHGAVYVRAYELHDEALLPSPPACNQPWKLKEQRSVVVEVEDNGVGICPRDQPRLFTRFFRSENPLSVEAGGNGLGLSIVRSLVHLHNGQIGFWSVEGKGSCFWVRLPAPSTEPLLDE
jgi:PAS domain S-box-containing protein